MKRYVNLAQEKANNGYATMVQLNGGAAIGEENRESIEKAIGIPNLSGSKKKIKPKLSTKPG
jgi:hypothetical protein